MATLNLLTDIAVIIIALEVFVILLIPAFILFFVVKGLSKLPGGVKHYGALAQARFRQAALIADQASQKAVAPLIEIDAFVARLRRIRRVL